MEVRGFPRKVGVHSYYGQQNPDIWVSIIWGNRVGSMGVQNIPGLSAVCRAVGAAIFGYLFVEGIIQHHFSIDRPVMQIFHDFDEIHDGDGTNTEFFAQLGKSALRSGSALHSVN